MDALETVSGVRSLRDQWEGVRCGAFLDLGLSADGQPISVMVSVICMMGPV